MDLSATLDKFTIGVVAGVIAAISVAFFLLEVVSPLEVPPMFATLFSLWVLGGVALKRRQRFVTAKEGFLLFVVGGVSWLYLRFPLVGEALLLAVLIGGVLSMMGLMVRAYLRPA